MKTVHIYSFVLLAGLLNFLPNAGFAQTPPVAPPSAEVSAARDQIAKTPSSAAAFINLATAEINAGHPDEAIAAASHALAMQYTDAPGAADGRPLAYYALAIAYAQKGDIAGALSQVDAGLSRYPGSPFLSNVKGILFVASGQFSRASEVLLPAFVSMAHTNDPNSFIPWGYLPDDADARLGYTLVISQYNAGQYPQALETARQLVALHDLGSVCVNPELMPKTRKQCAEFAGHGVQSIDGHDVSQLPDDCYGVRHFLKGPVGSIAETSYSVHSCVFPMPCSYKTHKLQIVRQAVPLTKDNADDFALFALALNANGDSAQALTMAQKAIALDPGSFWPILSYGVVMEDSNRLDEASKVLETPTAPTTVPLLEALRQDLRQIHRAVLYARKGDLAKAQELYLSVVSHIDPGFMPAVKEKDAFLALVQPMVIAHLKKAKQLDTEGKYAESLPEYAQTLSYAANEQEASKLRTAMFAASSKMPTPPEIPDEARRRVVRGELMLKDGQLDRALAEFNEALRMAPYVPKLYYNTALICGQLKQYEQAIRQMHLYLLAAPEAPDVRAAQDEITKWEMRLEMGSKQ